MKRTILFALATFATAGASTAAADNRISSSFIESVDRANEAKNDEISDVDRPRRKLGWWGVALFFAEHGPCHGPLQPPHCHRHHGGGGGGGGGSGGGGSGSGGGGGGSGYADDAYGQNGATDDMWGSDGHGADGSNGSETISARNEQHNSAGLMNPNSVSFWMMLAAAGAVAVAIAAMIVGSRRKEKENYHPLRGAVEKRMRLFGGFTDKCFGDRELCGADKEVEMGENSIEDEGYRSMA